MNIKNMTRLVLFGAIFSMGLSSCHVFNKYSAPNVDSLAVFRDNKSSDTSTIANIPWRDYFSDPILQALIDEGLNNNFDMQIAAYRIQQAEAGLSMARAAYFPNVALVGNVTQNRASNRDPLTNAPKETNVLKYHSETFVLGVAMTWEADIWGKLNKQSKARYAQYLNSQAGRKLVQTSLISNIATLYYSLTALDEQLTILKETVTLLDQNVQTMQAMMDAGLMNKAAVEQSKALSYNTKISIPTMEIQINQLENSLSLVLGRVPGKIERMSIRNQNIPKELSVGVPVQMLAKRPDVISAELGFRSAFELTNVARASFYPSITLNSGSMIGFGSVMLSNFFKPENIAANILAGITQPLFARKQLTSNLKITKADQEIALLNFKKTVLGASKEVSDILFTYESSLSKNKLRLEQVQSLKNAVEYTQLLLKAGEANYLEVINAEQGLLQAQLGQVNDKLEQLQASVNLYRALGGGVE